MSIQVNFNRNGNVTIESGSFNISGNIASPTEDTPILTIKPGCNITAVRAVAVDQLVLQSESSTKYAQLNINKNVSVYAEKSARQQYTVINGDGIYLLDYLTPELSQNSGGYYQSQRIEHNTSGVTGNIVIQDKEPKKIVGSASAITEPGIEAVTISQSTVQVSFNTISDYMTTLNVPSYTVIKSQGNRVEGLQSLPSDETTTTISNSVVSYGDTATVSDIAFLPYQNIYYSAAVNCRGYRNWTSIIDPVQSTIGVIYYYIGGPTGSFNTPTDWSYQNDGNPIDVEHITYSDETCFYIGRTAVINDFKDEEVGTNSKVNIDIRNKADVTINGVLTEWILGELSIKEQSKLKLNVDSVNTTNDSIIVVDLDSIFETDSFDIAADCVKTEIKGYLNSNVSINTSGGCILPPCNIRDVFLVLEDNNDFLFNSIQTYNSVSTVNTNLTPTTGDIIIYINKDIYVIGDISLNAEAPLNIVCNDSKIILNSDENQIITFPDNDNGEVRVSLTKNIGQITINGTIGYLSGYVGNILGIKSYDEIDFNNTDGLYINGQVVLNNDLKTQTLKLNEVTSVLNLNGYTATVFVSGRAEDSVVAGLGQYQVVWNQPENPNTGTILSHEQDIFIPVVNFDHYSTEDNNILLYWKAATEATSYTIQRSANGINFETIAHETIGTVEGNFIKYVDLDNVDFPNGVYYYRISTAGGTNVNSLRGNYMWSKIFPIKKRRIKMWNGLHDTNYMNTNNWQGGVLPTSTDDIEIPKNAIVERGESITGTNNVYLCEINHDYYGYGASSFNNTATITVYGSFLCKDGFSFNKLLIDNKYHNTWVNYTLINKNLTNFKIISGVLWISEALDTTDLVSYTSSVVTLGLFGSQRQTITDGRNVKYAIILGKSNGTVTFNNCNVLLEGNAAYVPGESLNNPCVTLNNSKILLSDNLKVDTIIVNPTSNINLNNSSLQFKNIIYLTENN